MLAHKRYFEYVVDTPPEPTPPMDCQHKSPEPIGKCQFCDFCAAEKETHAMFKEFGQGLLELRQNMVDADAMLRYAVMDKDTHTLTIQHQRDENNRLKKHRDNEIHRIWGAFMRRWEFSSYRLAVSNDKKWRELEVDSPELGKRRVKQERWPILEDVVPNLPGLQPTQSSFLHRPHMKGEMSHQAVAWDHPQQHPGVMALDAACGQEHNQRHSYQYAVPLHGRIAGGIRTMSGAVDDGIQLNGGCSHGCPSHLGGVWVPGGCGHMPQHHNSFERLRAFPFNSFPF